MQAKSHATSGGRHFLKISKLFQKASPSVRVEVVSAIQKLTPHQSYPLTAIQKGGGIGTGLSFCKPIVSLLDKNLKRRRTPLIKYVVWALRLCVSCET
ncbi:MAG: hypothetical protein A2742_03850 [Candidatus Yanofskybacteria bacterium RIFCSPHIGHO2_01_FULL_43_32]|nr:MAG: hypothetical protein A2742_03850 [Candidatus Yanofskybacteria bacterium RIFCSPHIGHO2_01_FULL_43_32]OGN11089.1 MAG: hypothetical protein A3C69_00170 [Candidatus Yanofskybacteria bacterium RIFCSPHIGHO2_02_FULL_43_12]OGN17195.1 MAG: hypothetical protein A3E34_00285 [Candidatus Yanofskybacteria bacterium RIFCSPHIGHO2_12_FULL_43_11]OGN24979.1 MAG: hypothetical protein A2923_03350 [Candidatus Yanofskybacteria bacterium RIFCSPLOWO2_01_FULL_43_46]